MRERNEALDTWLYARAAASHFGIDRFTEKQWQDLEFPLKNQKQAKPELEVSTPVVAKSTPVVSRKPEWIRPRSNWLGH